MKPNKYTEMSNLPGFIGTPKRKERKPPEGFNGAERDFQSLCEQYLDALGFCYLHIPAPLLRALFASQAVPVWIKRQVKQYIAYWPDLIMFKEGRYLAIELKTAKGRTSAGQRERLKEMEGHVCRDFDDFKQKVDTWTRKEK